MTTYSDSQRKAALVQAAILKATQLLQSGAPESALHVVTDAKTIGVPVINLDLVQCACLIALGRLEEARQALASELELFPTNEEAQKLSARLNAEMSDS